MAKSDFGLRLLALIDQSETANYPRDRINANVFAIHHYGPAIAETNGLCPR